MAYAVVQRSGQVAQSRVIDSQGFPLARRQHLRARQTNANVYLFIYIYNKRVLSTSYRYTCNNARRFFIVYLPAVENNIGKTI